MMLDAGIPQYWLTRFCFQRALAFIYVIAFLMVLNQFRGLLGDRGLLPAGLFLRRVEFWDSPSVFFLHYSDSAAMIAAGVGLLLALAALSGLSDTFGAWVSIAVWGSLWLIYLSFVNIGQTFYGFGWEILLLESGFLPIFLGSTLSPPPAGFLVLLHSALFQLLFGPGL